MPNLSISGSEVKEVIGITFVGGVDCVGAAVGVVDEACGGGTSAVFAVRREEGSALGDFMENVHEDATDEKPNHR